MNEESCFVCNKHRSTIAVPDGPIYVDDLVYAAHAAIPDDGTSAYLGAIILEPRRHVDGLAGLTAAEAQRFGLWIQRLSRALEESEKAEHVYLFVLGHQVRHLHAWIVPRYAGTPRAYWGLQLFSWPEAPRGDAAAIATLSTRIRDYLRQTYMT